LLADRLGPGEVLGLLFEDEAQAEDAPRLTLVAQRGGLAEQGARAVEVVRL
jgi:hypothetical protein